MAEAKTYYLEQNYNCAETILHAANAKFGMNISEEDMKLLSGFGGGMGCGETCGALAASIGVLGRLFVNPKAHETEGFKEMSAEYVAAFRKELGALDCNTVKAKYFVGDGTRCLKTVEICEKLLTEFVESHKN